MKDVCSFCELRHHQKWDLFDVICGRDCAMRVSEKGSFVSMDGWMCIVPLCINQSLSHVSPPSLDPISLLYYLILSSVPVFPPCCAPLYLLMFTTCPTSRFLFLFSVPIIRSSRPLFLICRPSFHRPKVISTGRPSMRIQCWRLRGAGSWNSSSLSSLSPKASSHLKVSATSEVRSQAPTKGVISFLSIHVCD